MHINLKFFGYILSFVLDGGSGGGGERIHSSMTAIAFLEFNSDWARVLLICFTKFTSRLTLAIDFHNNIINGHICSFPNRDRFDLTEISRKIDLILFYTSRMRGGACIASSNFPYDLTVVKSGFHTYVGSPY